MSFHLMEIAMRGLRYVVAGVVAIALIIAGFLYYLNQRTSSMATAPSQKLTIGVATWIGYGALYIAKERGFFGSTDIELKRIDDPAVYSAAMLRRDIDGFCASMDSFATAIGGGVTGRVVFLFDESAGADGVVVKPSIQTVQDLKGKKIAAQPGWPGHFFLLFLTKQEGLKRTDYSLINLDADKAGAAFLSGDLDAAVTWEPWLSKIRDSGSGKILVSSKQYPGLILDGLVIRPEILDSRPAAVRALINGTLQAIDYWKANPAEGNEIVARNFSLKPEEVGSMIQGVRYLDRKLNQEYLRKGGKAEETLNAAINIWVDDGQMKRPAPLQNPVTDLFVQ